MLAHVAWHCQNVGETFIVHRNSIFEKLPRGKAGVLKLLLKLIAFRNSTILIACKLLSEERKVLTQPLLAKVDCE